MQEQVHNKQTEISISETDQNPISDPNPDLSFSNQHSENLNQNLNNLNVLSQEKNNNSQNKNEDKIFVNNNDLDLDEFTKIEKDTVVKSNENPADTVFAKASDTPKSNEYQLLNENMLNDEDEIKNEIQAIDNTFVNSANANEKENVVDKHNQEHYEDYVMDEFPEKIKAENHQNDLDSNNNLIDINNTVENNNITPSNDMNDNRNRNNNTNQPQNISNNQVQEDRNCK